MRRTILLAIVGLSGCTTTLEGTTAWSEFHGNGPNAGFRPVHSGNSLVLQWATEVGAVALASPVIGPAPHLHGGSIGDMIYVCTFGGDLVAVDARGSIQWRRSLSGTHMVSAPTVGHDGAIHVVASTISGEQTRSNLLRISALGDIEWAVPFPNNGFTTASPKICRLRDRSFIFVTSQEPGSHRLLAFDLAGTVLDSERISCHTDVVGQGILDSIDDIDLVDLLHDLTGHIFEWHSQPSPASVLLRSGQDPTPAVVADGPLVSPGTAFVVVSDRCGQLQGFRWNPPNLTPEWATDRGYGRVVGSPVVVGDEVYAGFENGWLRGFNARTGAQVRRENMNGKATGAASSSGRWLYVTTTHELHSIDLFGSAHLRRPLIGATVASPAQTLDRVFVSANDALTAFSLDLESATPAQGSSNGGGIAAPAVGADGTIYAIVGRELRAYSTTARTGGVDTTPR